MFLRCPHCDDNADHLRSDFFGDWVVCPFCELPFAWREAHLDEEAEESKKNGVGRGNGNGHGNEPARANGTAGGVGPEVVAEAGRGSDQE